MTLTRTISIPKPAEDDLRMVEEAICGHKPFSAAVMFALRRSLKDGSLERWARE